MREPQRHGRDRGFAFGELGIDRPRNLSVHMSLFEITTVNISRVRNGRANTQRCSAAGLDSVSAGHESNLARAEHVIHTEAKLRTLLAPFGDSQLLRWRSQDRQLR